ncbi:MAG: glycosyltransferase [Motilibacteraceae bacterium]
MPASVSAVSVVVPCYRYGNFLPQCLDSVLSQEDVDVEVLVIDDASPDGSGDVARELGAADERVSVRVHDRNHGHIATYNEGLDWATGDLVLLLSADDVLLPGALARAARVFAAHPSVGLVYGPAVDHRGDGPYDGPVRRSSVVRVWPGHEWFVRRCADMDNPVPTPSAVVRGDVQRRVGGYRENAPYAGDLEMWLRIAAVSDVGVLSADQAVYRQHGDNMCARDFPAVQDTFEHSRRAYESVLDEYADVLRDVDELRRVVRREVARRALRMSLHLHVRGAGGGPDARWLQAHAEQLWPDVRRSPDWWAVRGCQVLGPSVAGRVGPAADRVRRRPRQHA